MLHHIIVLTPVYVSLFWALVLLCNRYSFNRPRFWLGIFMLMAACLYGSHALYFSGAVQAYLRVDFIYVFSALSVYPLYYIYVRLLACDVRLKRSYAWHLLPAVLLSLAMFLLSSVSSQDEKQMYFDVVLVTQQFPAPGLPGIVRGMAVVFLLTRFIFGFQVIYYLIRGYWLVRKYDQRIANFYSNIEGRKLLWVRMLTISLFLASIASSVANILGRGLFLKHDLLLAIPSGIFSTLLFVIGFLGGKQDYNIRALKQDEEEAPCDTKPGESKKNSLKADLLESLVRENIYLNADLRICELCKKLNTNRTYLSNLINDEFNLSFSDFINRYRVEHACRLIEADADGRFSLETIAAESGFGSVSSFNRAFKKEKGITAGQFRRKLPEKSSRLN
jgi:AraC-like DNA-binding protein